MEHHLEPNFLAFPLVLLQLHAEMIWNGMQPQDRMDGNCGTPLCMSGSVCAVIVSNEPLDWLVYIIVSYC